jgi:serine/threonine protein kinase/tetratricopeptide (TPR) repeat protein
VTPQRWQDVKSWFALAADSSPAERDALLAKAENQDPDLARELRRLLSQPESAAAFLESPVSLAGRLRASVPFAVAVQPGEMLAGRFEIRRKLGQGGMGQVFEAFDRELGTTVALKTLGSLTTLEESARLRLGREVLAAREVTHPNVCRTFDYGRHESESGVIPFLTMEFLAGESLAERIAREGPLPESEAWIVAAQMAAALDAAHKAGVVHRDFKPGNVMLVREPEARVVVTDFGLATGEPAGPVSDRTETGELFGTLSYMAPEVLGGDHATAAADIYSFGLVLYEMTTGVNPFGEVNPFAGAVRRATRDVESPRKHVPGLTAAWERCVLACLEREPARRPPSAAQALEAVRSDPRLRLPRVLKGRNRLFLSVSSLLCLGLALFPFATRYLKMRTQVSAGAMVMVSDVQNLTGDPELNGATILLRQQLAQSSYVNVLEPERIAGAMARMDKPNSPAADAHTIREIALREGCPMAAFGNLTRLGSDLELQLKVERLGATPDSVLASRNRSWTLTGKAQVMGAIREASSWIRELAGESRTDIAGHDRPPEDVTTSSWHALQLFGQAEMLQAQGRNEDAVGLLKEATRLDPDFTLAYMRIGDIRLGQRLYDEGEQWWQKALAILGNRKLADREELRIRSMYAGDSGDFRECERLYRTFAIRFPNDWYARVRHGLALSQVDELEGAAEEIRTAEKLRPGMWLMPASLAKVATSAGRYDEAVAASSRLRSMGQASWADCIAAEVALLRGDLQSARTGFEKLASSRDGIWRGRGPMLLASLEAELGRYTAAIQVLDQAIARDLDSDLKAEVAQRLLAKAWMQAKLGMGPEALVAVERALTVDSGAQSRLQAGVLFARLGKVQRARALRATFRNNGKFGINATAPHLLEGEIALAMGDPDAAIRDFRTAHQFEPPARHQEPLARALIHRGDLQQALALYQQMVARPGHLWVTPDQDWPGLWMDSVQVEIALAERLRLEEIAKDARALYRQYRPGPEPRSLLRVGIP